MTFACERAGLAQALGPSTLGDYDGSGLWRVFLSRLATTREQLLVEFHEGLHHELQLSSAWGLVCAMSAALAHDGFNTTELNAVVAHMVDGSRVTHETFATVISGLAVGEAETTELLLGNPLYTDYFQGGLSLVARRSAPNIQLYSAAVAAVLRVCMSPAAAEDLFADGFDQLHITNIDLTRESPDARLAAYRGLGGPDSWQPVFDDLMDPHRARVRIEDARHPTPLPDEHSQEFAQLRRFEEEVLLPACYRHVQQLLEGVGMPSLGVASQSRFAIALKSAVTKLNPALGARLRVVSERRSAAEDMLEFDRQQIVLRDRLPTRCEAFTGAPDQIALYRADDPSAPHICAVWISRRAAAKQWLLPEKLTDSSAGDAIVAFVQGAVSAGKDCVSVALLDSASSPRDVQNLVGDALPVLVLTTHSSLADEQLTALLSRATPVFVMMDLPVIWHVDHWIGQGATVRFAVSPLTGISSAELWLAAFMIDFTPGMVFLSINGAVAITRLSERIRNRPDGQAPIVDPAVLSDNRAGINLAVSHIFTLWSLLDQNGTLF